MDNVLTTLTLEQLLEHPRNPRRSFDEGALSELAESIRSVGILQPVVVRPALVAGSWEIVCGHRRVRAARIAGLSTVPAIVRSLTDREAAFAQLVENCQRADVPPLEESNAIARLVEAGVDEGEVAARLGRPIRFVKDRLRLQNLIGEYQQALESEQLPIGGALLLASLPPERQEELLDRPGYGRLAPWKEGETWEAWTIRKVEDCIRGVSRLLSRVPWSLADATLSPRGACDTCAIRSGAQPDLWATDASGQDRCLDRVCYDARTSAWIAKRQAEGADVREGRPDYTTSISVTQAKMYKEEAPVVASVIASMPKTVYIENGEVTPMLDRAALATELDRLGLAEMAQRLRPVDLDKTYKEKQRAEELARKTAQAAHEQKVQAVAQRGLTLDARTLLDIALQGALQDDLRQVCKRREVVVQKAEPFAAALLRHAELFNAGQLHELAIELWVTRAFPTSWQAGHFLDVWVKVQRAAGLQVLDQVEVPNA
jgi:ParB/RepB/Spo0J family partition protein